MFLKQSYTRLSKICPEEKLLKFSKLKNIFKIKKKYKIFNVKLKNIKNIRIKI